MKRTYQIIFLVLILILFICLLPGCTNAITYTSKNAFLLDTIINIKVYYYTNDPIDESVIDDAFALIESYERLLSIHIEDSDLDRLAENAGVTPVTVDPFTYDILKTSVEYSQLSGGMFDVTAGPLIDLWAIDPPNGHIPTSEELDTVLPLIGYNRIIFYDNNQVMLADKGMVANLGAIAKGAITDEVKRFLMENGATSALINAGGNVLPVGTKPDGSAFSVGVQKPEDARGAYLLALESGDKAVVSSGDYERYFEVDGQRYHHILNPFTGYPVDTNISQITIVTDDGITADALSTTVLLLGITDGLALIESLDNAEAVFITKDNQIYITEGLRPLVTENTAEMDGYTIVEALN